ncbi:DUF2726 domain-containing protein [Deinococcus sp.]|uniref:DUF2726 domain-containing protein n=1 Tax=Deinococcus sp. TaxID=47478 RepID=UPI003CC5F70F
MWILIVVVIAVLAFVFSRLGKLGQEAGEAAPPRAATALPESLPVAVKRSFFSCSEQTLFGNLNAVLEGTPYTVFPNVRLNDLFTITDRERRQSTYNRLRDKHVDFLIVSRDGFAPALAIELDGDSHEREVQQKRDQVKDLAFRSAGLTLLRLDARQPHPASALSDQLTPHLLDLKGQLQTSATSGPVRRR